MAALYSPKRASQPDGGLTARPRHKNDSGKRRSKRWIARQAEIDRTIPEDIDRMAAKKRASPRTHGNRRRVLSRVLYFGVDCEEPLRG